MRFSNSLVLEDMASTRREDGAAGSAGEGVESIGQIVADAGVGLGEEIGQAVGVGGKCVTESLLVKLELGGGGDGVVDRFAVSVDGAFGGRMIGR